MIAAKTATTNIGQYTGPALQTLFNMHIELPGNYELWKLRNGVLIGITWYRLKECV